VDGCEGLHQLLRRDNASPARSSSGYADSQVDLTQPSLLSLNIQNLSTPPSVVQNSIGFQTLPPGFVDGSQIFSTGYTLTGTMNIGLSNVTTTLSKGIGVRSQRRECRRDWTDRDEWRSGKRAVGSVERSKRNHAVDESERGRL
jgi:hypothetical protein